MLPSLFSYILREECAILHSTEGIVQALTLFLWWRELAVWRVDAHLSQRGMPPGPHQL